MSIKSRHLSAENIWPQNRCLYYSNFQPTHYRRSDGYRVQQLCEGRDILYTDGHKTFRTSYKKFDARFSPRD